MAVGEKLVENVLYVVMDIEIPQVDHRCGPDCPCWQQTDSVPQTSSSSIQDQD